MYGTAMTVSIHQPNFVPYYGFFQKMMQSDIMVIMCHCQFEKNNYQNRFKTHQWNTMRVSKKTEDIVHKKYLSPLTDWSKMLETHPELEVFNDCINEELVSTNLSIILRAKEILNIKTMILIDGPTNLTGTDRLIDIVKRAGGDTYLSGISGRNYLDLPKFGDIKVNFQENIINEPLINFL